MKKAIALMVISMLFGMGMNAQVTADFDKSVDFSVYKTYSFLGWQKDSDSLLNDFDKKRLHDAFQSEFTARGLSYVENGGDMNVSLFIFTQAKSDVTAYTDYTGGMGYGRAGWGMGVGMGTSTTSFSENDYTQGTLVLDCYDAKDNKLIFQGVSQKTVQKKPSKREKTIPKAVAKLMYKFPVDKVKVK